MNIIKTEIPDVIAIEPRGFFFESFNQKVWQEKTGIKTTFVQDKHSRSGKNVLRGLHYQIQQPQGKLIWAVRGAVFDVLATHRGGVGNKRIIGSSLALFGKIEKRFGHFEEHLDVLVSQSHVRGQ